MLIFDTEAIEPRPDTSNWSDYLILKRWRSPKRLDPAALYSGLQLTAVAAGIAVPLAVVSYENVFGRSPLRLHLSGANGEGSWIYEESLSGESSIRNEYLGSFSEPMLFGGRKPLGDPLWKLTPSGARIGNICAIGYDNGLKLLGEIESRGARSMAVTVVLASGTRIVYPMGSSLKCYERPVWWI